MCPFYILVADFIRSGELLLWDSVDERRVAGRLGSDRGILPADGGPGLVDRPKRGGLSAHYWLTIWALGGLGVLPLARHLGAPSWAGCLAAIGWMFSGIYIGQAQLTCFIYSMVFLPWIIWRFDAAVACRSWSAAVQAGALWGLSALSGYPGLTILTSGYVLLWGAGGCSVRRGRAARPDRRAGRTISGGSCWPCWPSWASGRSSTRRAS